MTMAYEWQFSERAIRNQRTLCAEFARIALFMTANARMAAPNILAGGQ
jgi:hypothetical protein